MIGLVRPQSGEVWIDDLPLSEVDLKSWRTMVGYVAQETFLLHESIMVNVTLGDKAVTSDEVEQALRDAGIWEFVSALPNGMSTPVGERGSASLRRATATDSDCQSLGSQTAAAHSR